MIKSFRHKGLSRFFSTGSLAGVQPAHSKRLRLILGRLNVSTKPQNMALPGLRLHPLKGRESGRWSVWVSGNWRVTFSFEADDACGVDYEDYH